MPWLNSSTHLLVTSPGKPDHGFTTRSRSIKGDKETLPPPELPPNGTHSQQLHVFFTHREEPAMILTALGLWNYTSSANEASWNPPLDHIDRNREWHTSHILPFLGHVALERLACNVTEALSAKVKTIQTIRVVVNGAGQKLPSCQNGPGGSCLIDDFEEYIRVRMERYEDIEGVCSKDS